MPQKTQKQELRKSALKQRDAMPVARRIDYGLSAAEQSVNELNFDPGTIISGFLPIRSEIDIRPLMDGLRTRGARLCLPVVIDKTTIIFRELIRTQELVDTGFGTSGPGPDTEVLDPHWLLVPLSVFDNKGGRIGYGAGHYDRAIARLMAKGITPTLIGCAFECQCVDEVPMEDHDQYLHAIITENGYRVCNKF